MASYSDDDDETADYHGDYTLEEYDIGPTEMQKEAEDKSNIDFRMDAPPPTTSMESRIRAAAEDLPPDGMQLSRPTPGCCPGESSHTGPKAVKADYEAAKQVLRNQRMMDRMRRERALQNSVRVDLSALQMTPAEQAQIKKAQKKKDSDNDSDEDEDDDAAFEQYRQQRIAFVQNSLPRFGVHTRVSKSEFASLVKDVHELVYVVCHLYQNNIEACVRLNLSFEALAPQFPHVRFCRLRSNEAMPGFKAAGLPALLVYRGGEMVHQALRVSDALPKVFSDVDVAKLLQAKGILTVPTGLTDSSSKRLREDFMTSTKFSDDENEAAEAENEGGILGLNLLSTSSSSSSAASRPTNAGRSHVRKGITTMRRAADSSGSDSD